MKNETFDHIWDYAIVPTAKNILDRERTSFDDNSFKSRKDDVKIAYDNMRGFSKFAYLKDPDGLSNRYLVSAYLILAIAKTKPLNAGINEGTLKNEQLAIRIGMWVICLFREYQNRAKIGRKTSDPEEFEKELKIANGLWNKDDIETLLKTLDLFEKFFCYHLYYDISDKIYSILELSNIIWMIEAYIDEYSIIKNESGKTNVDDEKIGKDKTDKEKSAERNNGEVQFDKEERIHACIKQCIFQEVVSEWARCLDRRWDSIWNDNISAVAMDMVDKYKERIVFDRTSKYIILNEYLLLLDEARSNYMKLSGVSSNKYMIAACFILAIAKSQPLRYKYDIHARKGIYNENLALEAGLRLLYEFGSFDSDHHNNCKNKTVQRYVFPKPFQNKTYKELLCLMLHYDIRENKYSILAIANILLMIEVYTYVFSLIPNP